jgi:ribosomal protein S18 acetylase RimI-like enzyme
LTNSEFEDLPGSQAVIQPATWRDLNGLRHLEQVCFPKDAWPLLDLVGVLTLPNIVRLKATVGEMMVGFIAGDIRPHQHLAWIATIGVLPEFQGRGIASMLLKACENRLDMPRIRLCVRVGNLAAIQLYQAASYQRTAVWKDYYQDHEDALVMEKKF